MMTQSLRIAILAMSLVITACPARSGSEGGTGGGSGGGGGSMRVDSGTLTPDSGAGGGTGGADSGSDGADSGTGGADSGTDGGTGTTDAGPVIPETISAAKRVTWPALVNLKGVVVTAISFAARSNSTGADCVGSTTKGANASFWVADPNVEHSGVFVSKFRCDAPYDYLPTVGDVLDIKGYIGVESRFDGRERSRVVVKQQYDFLSPNPPTCNAANNCQPLEMTLKTTMAPLGDTMVDGTFGGGGSIRANPTYAGSRVKITAALSISEANPLELKRASLLPNDDRYFGFKLSNGVLVNNYLTFATFAADGGLLEDGGTSACDFRLVALDGGAVNFTSIAGVWDTYTYTGCQDGGIASNCFKAYGVIPGTDAGYTNVLYPISCADFTRAP